MLQVCAWCKKQYGEIPDGSWPPGTITHGLCAACAKELLGDSSSNARRFLDKLHAPVLVVDQNGRVLTANNKAQDLVGKELPDIEGFPGGEVFDCANAALPGGCGQTVHCSGCTIRNTVMETFSTGQSQYKSPVWIWIDRKSSHSSRTRLNLHISTQRVEGVVLLRIDEVRTGG